MNQSLPRISIVIPVRNNAGTIEKAIKSVLDQGFPNTELIILDGGSTDGTVDVIKRYESQIAYWHSKPDGGPGPAVNFGLTKIVTGDIVGQLMADDWYEPGTFTLVSQAYQQNSGVEIISFAGRIVMEEKEVGRYDRPEQLEINLYNTCYGIPALNARFITKRYYDKIGIMEAVDKNGKHNYSNDREILIRAAILGCHHVFVPHLGHTYLAHAGSTTFVKNRKVQNKILQEHMDYVKDYFNKYDLTKEQKRFLYAWYADQSVRLFIWSLLDGDFIKAFSVSRQGLSWTTLPWLSAFFTVPASWLRKNLLVCRYNKVGGNYQ